MPHPGKRLGPSVLQTEVQAHSNAQETTTAVSSPCCMVGSSHPISVLIFWNTMHGKCIWGVFSSLPPQSVGFAMGDTGVAKHIGKLCRDRLTSLETSRDLQRVTRRRVRRSQLG